jgi:diguanylate cyclase (GGDEF)-like protein
MFILLYHLLGTVLACWLLNTCVHNYLPIFCQEKSLEQFNQFYDTRVDETYFNLEKSEHELSHAQNQGLTQVQLNKFILKLLTTIDLPKLTEIYFQHLKNTLPLSELKIQYEDSRVKFGQPVENVYLKTLNCMQNDIAVAVVHYSFTQPLSLKNWQILQHMHVNFCFPLKNAIEHYRVKQFAMKDFLTSLGNRANYNETMVRLSNQSQRRHQPFGLLIVDIDNFKQVNDFHGHQEGDKVVMAVADTILHSIRETDFAFRFGGDEFCCLLPEANNQTNNLIAQRVLDAIESNLILQQHKISCSIGSSTYREHDSQKGIFSRADEALYNAKQAGKNCIRTA